MHMNVAGAKFYADVYTQQPPEDQTVEEQQLAPGDVRHTCRRTDLASKAPREGDGVGRFGRKRCRCASSKRVGHVLSTDTELGQSVLSRFSGVVRDVYVVWDLVGSKCRRCASRLGPWPRTLRTRRFDWLVK